MYQKASMSPTRQGKAQRDREDASAVESMESPFSKALTIPMLAPSPRQYVAMTTSSGHVHALISSPNSQGWLLPPPTNRGTCDQGSPGTEEEAKLEENADRRVR